MGEPVSNLREFCRRILTSGDLASKLEPPPWQLDDSEPGPATQLLQPARESALAMRAGAERLPPPTALGNPVARIRCLARFAHHELMAVELFAWALLRWPALPAGLRRGLLHVLADEQRHCGLYLERLRELGSDLGEHVHSDYFWKNLPRIAASPHGPRAFLCAMGLTLEQANLDFSLLYRDAFRAAGDERSAAVCQQVHDDEVRHVRIAAAWLLRLSPGQSDVEAYEEAVPYPFGAPRAKGRRFDSAARRRAGLSDAFIETVRTARVAHQLRRV